MTSDGLRRDEVEEKEDGEEQRRKFGLVALFPRDRIPLFEQDGTLFSKWRGGDGPWNV